MTAVEWLVNELREKFPTRLKSMYNSNQLLLESLVVKAKEMEKQQIEDAFYQTELDEFGDEVEFEQYYNETFKTK